jgi:hypothetical protein
VSQWNPHAAAVHVALACIGASHTPVQLPQWAGSVCVSTHDVPHRARPPEHALLHA